MSKKDHEEEGFHDKDDGLLAAVERAHRAYLNPPRPLEVHPRANEAKEDYLIDIPGPLYRLMRDDIASVWGLLESPIEQVAIFQFAGENYSSREGWPIYAKVAKARGLYPHSAYPVQIIPQVKFGPYRVDFLFDLGGRGLFAIECDGEEFHADKARDRNRDDYLHREHGVIVLRLPGKNIWGGNQAALTFVDLIKVYLK